MSKLNFSVLYGYLLQESESHWPLFSSLQGDTDIHRLTTPANGDWQNVEHTCIYRFV